MRAVVNTLMASAIAVGLAACALLQPVGRDDDARRAAKVTLTAYEATQQAILIYGHLPACDPEAGVMRLCRDRATWTRIKVVEASATKAIAAATPVLNGSTADAGQLVAALIAVEEVKAAVTTAHRQLAGERP